MRATEALHLSNPDNKLDQELKDICTHFDYNRHKDEIKSAGKENRRPMTLFECL